QPTSLEIAQVPNRRLVSETALMEWLRDGDGAMTIGTVRQHVSSTSVSGVDPAELWELSEKLPYHVELYWPGPASDDAFHAIFHRISAENGNGHKYRFEPHTGRTKPWKEYANNPGQGLFARKLVPELHRFLEAHLPEHMLPSSFLLVDDMPLTSS